MFHFAWVEPTETAFTAAHSREDEDVFSLQLEHTEGDFPMLSIEIRNPRRQLLSGTNIWAWLSQDGVPLFFGRLVAIPEQMTNEIVRLNFVARPADYQESKRALAASLRVRPFWDPVWINDERIADPDTVLEARTELWHIDRISHAVTVSDIIYGEDGTLVFGEGDFEYESLSASYGAPPVRRVRVEADVSWDQVATGSLDISRMFGALDATQPLGKVASYTGQGLEADWPKEGARLGGGWSVGPTKLTRMDGVSVPARYTDVNVQAVRPVSDAEGSAADAFVSEPISARFYVWEFAVSFGLTYDVARARFEKVKFDLVGDVQSVLSEPGQEEEIVLGLATQKVTALIDEGGAMPIGDLRKPAYIKTDRGKQSLEYLIALARSKLLARARMVDVTVALPFAAGLDMSCRKNATINDDRLPGGTATGKIVSYRMIADGNGYQRTEMKIGCTVGTGATVDADVGTPTYVADEYEDNYQVNEGETTAPIGGSITYGDLSAAPIADDGIDFFDLDAADMVTRLDVLNGEAVQAGLLASTYPDIPAAVEALNAAHTEIWLELVPLVGGPFETVYDVPVSPLMVPRTITL